MSAIGPGSLGAISMAGTQQAAKTAQKESADAKTVASAKKFQVDQTDHVEKASGISDTDLSEERDADGRLQYQASQQEESDDSSEKQSPQKKSSQPDAFGDSSTIININA